MLIVARSVARRAVFLRFAMRYVIIEPYGRRSVAAMYLFKAIRYVSLMVFPQHVANQKHVPQSAKMQRRAEKIQRRAQSNLAGE